MKHVRLLLSLFLFIGGPILLVAQESEDVKKVELGGYVKFLNTTTSIDGLDESLLDNLIHNRFNLKWYIEPEWTLTVEMRNRIFWGDNYRLNPFFEDQLDLGAKDYLDLSTSFIKSAKFLGHSALDRAYLEYNKDKWNIRLGRQRINWGINLIWNPNDVFNAYNFVDFDYEERPGSDALRVQYNYSYASSIEFVFNPSRISNQQSYAALWKTNKWNYDFQFLSGKVDRDIVIGAGWAGNIGLWGFKGEFVFANNLDQIPNSFSATIGLDFAFESGNYLSFGYLFSDIEAGTFSDLFNTQLSFKNLFPYPHAIFNQWQFQISPLINGGGSIIYAPSADHLIFFNPTFTASVSQNVDFDLVGQIVFVDQNKQYDSPLQSIFLRFKYSF